MERELVWKQVYRAIRSVSKQFPLTHPGPGHPDVHPTWVIAVCWLWACLWRDPMATAMRTLRSVKKRRLLGQMGFSLPAHIPDGSTVCRRMQRPDFSGFLSAVHRALVVKLLTADSCQTLLGDSSPLDIPTISHDSDARFGHHGHFGYRLHTLMTQDKIVIEAHACPSNDQELAIMPALIQRAAANGVRCRYMAADIGYDSEALHRQTRDCLGGMLVAPLNDRGGTRTMMRTPLRKALWKRWNTPAIRKVRRKRGEIERAYSLLKGPLAIDSLPRHIRGLPRVRRYLLAETILYHGYLRARRTKNTD
jgi:hypothetical protein